MEYLYLFYNDLTVLGITHPSWIIPLSGILVILLGIQMYFYVGVYGKLSRFRNNKGIRQEIPSPSVSIVVVVRENAYSFVENILPLLLAQQYEPYEVVVVDCSYDEEIGLLLEEEKNRHSHLHVTTIRMQPRRKHNIKLALTVGIKAARFEHIVFTKADSYPVSDKWLSLMAKGFICGEIVIGYCGIEPRPGFVNRMIRTSRLMTSVRYLSAAIRGKTYRGISQNIGYTQSLYFGNKGYTHLNMEIGDDDLFIQRICTPDNVSVVMNPNASVQQIPFGGLSWWYNRSRYLGSAYRYYPRRAKGWMNGELFSRFLFFATAGVFTALLPTKLIAIPLSVVAMRWVVVLMKIRKIATRLGEKGLTGTYILFDLWGPWGALWMGLCRKLTSRNKIWQ